MQQVWACSISQCANWYMYYYFFFFLRLGVVQSVTEFCFFAWFQSCVSAPSSNILVSVCFYSACSSIVGRIKTQTGTLINIPSDDANSDVIRIEGSPEGVVKAKEALLELSNRMVCFCLQSSPCWQLCNAHFIYHSQIQDWGGSAFRMMA